MSWADLHAAATVISQSGQVVTQIHTRSDVAPESWSHGDNSAHVFAGADVDMVVTSTGQRFTEFGVNQ